MYKEASLELFPCVYLDIAQFGNLTKYHLIEVERSLIGIAFQQRCRNRADWKAT